MLEIVDNRTSPARLKVFGVGGGGSNAVNRMIQAGLSGVEFWVANTDLQALDQSVCVNRLQIGRTVTRGLGAGGDPEIGRLSAEDLVAELERGPGQATAEALVRRARDAGTEDNMTAVVARVVNGRS